MTEALYQAMAQSVIDGDTELASKLAQEAVVSGIDPLEAISKGFVVGVNFIGEAFSKGDAFLPELVMAGEAMKAAVGILEPEMARRGTARQVLGKVVLATVEGDIHEIGKTLVGTMLSASGFQVFDLGVNVPVGKLISTAIAEKADIIAVSALLTTTMVKQKELVDTLTAQGIRSQFKVLVGGAPVTREWVRMIGADGYSEDAVGAVIVARQFVSA